MPHWVLRGVWEMLRARLALGSIKPGDIRVLNDKAGRVAGEGKHSDLHHQTVDRIAFIIGLLGRKLPWRSDCLIQALAAQKWLLRLGIASTITVGVDSAKGAKFAAHAWLMQDERVILGGNIDRYCVLFGET